MSHKIVILSVLFVKYFCKCCDCGWKNVQSEVKDVTIEKRNLADNVRPKNEFSMEGIDASTVVTSSDLAYEMNTEADQNLNEEDIFERSCPYFTKVSNIGLDTISDVWQTAYYRTNEAVACFKMYIRKVTLEEQKYNDQMYGDFNGTLNWNSSIFEIHSNDKYFIMKHYLFGDGSDYGVFQNIIIIEENDGNNTKIVLQEESPDQWMVDKNLLLMRDCDTGEVVVFSRVPHESKMREIQDSLILFEEYNFDGRFACVAEREVNPEATKYFVDHQYYVRGIKKVLRDVFNKLVSMTTK